MLIEYFFERLQIIMRCEKSCITQNNRAERYEALTILNNNLKSGLALEKFRQIGQFLKKNT